MSQSTTRGVYESVITRLWSQLITAETCRAGLEAELRDHHATVDRLNAERAQKDATLQGLHAQCGTDRAHIELITRQLHAVDEEVHSLTATISSRTARLEQYADRISALSQQVVHRDAVIEQQDEEIECLRRLLIEADGVVAEGLTFYSVMDPQAVEVHHDLLTDLYRSQAYLAPSVTITHQVVGAVIWVLAMWHPSQSNLYDADYAPPNDDLPLTLRIELDPTGYTTSPLPPKFKITQVHREGDEEFPVGHRIVHLMNEYMGRCWGRGGFNPHVNNIRQQSPSQDAYIFDIDPRCVVPDTIDEGGLIAHLVRYAMLRMETYADFCVVCDRPLRDKRDTVCGREQCDHSFHEVGVGYASVGLERTVDTALGLRYVNPPRRSNVAATINYNAQSDPLNACNALMLSHVNRYLPTAEHHAWVCSAGSKGYCATKDMLQNGTRGNTLLIESRDLRDVEKCPREECCLVYTLEAPVGIDRYLLDICYHKFKDHIPPKVKHVAVYSNDDFLSPEFLGGITSLTSIDLSPLSSSRLEVVHKTFLRGCTGLTSLDLSPLSQVTVIMSEFLRGCSGLTQLDLSPLSQVTEVHPEFLWGCSGLTTLDLSPLSRVSVLREFFLVQCSGLTALDLSPLSQVTEVHGVFLYGCSGLTTIDLSPLSKITQISEFFLAKCAGLTVIDLSPLSRVTEVHNAFLGGCSGLTALDLSPLSQVTDVPQKDFLEGCWRIVVIENPPPLCTEVPEGWSLRTDGTTNQWVRPTMYKVGRGLRLGGREVAGKCIIQ